MNNNISNNPCTTPSTPSFPFKEDTKSGEPGLKKIKSSSSAADSLADPRHVFLQIPEGEMRSRCEALFNSFPIKEQTYASSLDLFKLTQLISWLGTDSRVIDEIFEALGSLPLNRRTAAISQTLFITEKILTPNDEVVLCIIKTLNLLPLGYCEKCDGALLKELQNIFTSFPELGAKDSLFFERIKLLPNSEMTRFIQQIASKRLIQRIKHDPQRLFLLQCIPLLSDSKDINFSLDKINDLYSRILFPKQSNDLLKVLKKIPPKQLLPILEIADQVSEDRKDVCISGLLDILSHLPPEEMRYHLPMVIKLLDPQTNDSDINKKISIMVAHLILINKDPRAILNLLRRALNPNFTWSDSIYALGKVTFYTSSNLIAIDQALKTLIHSQILMILRNTPIEEINEMLSFAISELKKVSNLRLTEMFCAQLAAKTISLRQSWKNLDEFLCPAKQSPDEQFFIKLILFPFIENDQRQEVANAIQRVYFENKEASPPEKFLELLIALPETISNCLTKRYKISCLLLNYFPDPNMAYIVFPQLVLPIQLIREVKEALRDKGIPFCPHFESFCMNLKNQPEKQEQMRDFLSRRLQSPDEEITRIVNNISKTNSLFLNLYDLEPLDRVFSSWKEPMKEPEIFIINLIRANSDPLAALQSVSAKIKENPNFNWREIFCELTKHFFTYEDPAILDERLKILLDERTTVSQLSILTQTLLTLKGITAEKHSMISSAVIPEILDERTTSPCLLKKNLSLLKNLSVEELSTLLPFVIPELKKLSNSGLAVYFVATLLVNNLGEDIRKHWHQLDKLIDPKRSSDDKVFIKSALMIVNKDSREEVANLIQKIYFEREEKMSDVEGFIEFIISLPPSISESLAKRKILIFLFTMTYYSKREIELEFSKLSLLPIPLLIEVLEEAREKTTPCLEDFESIFTRLTHQPEKLDQIRGAILEQFKPTIHVDDMRNVVEMMIKNSQLLNLSGLNPLNELIKHKWGKNTDATLPETIFLLLRQNKDPIAALLSLSAEVKENPNIRWERILYKLTEGYVGPL